MLDFVILGLRIGRSFFVLFRLGKKDAVLFFVSIQLLFIGLDIIFQSLVIIWIH